MDCCIASNVLQISQEKSQCYSIAECTKWYLLLFSQHSGEMLLSLLLVGHHMLSQSIMWDKTDLTSPNEDDSPGLVIDVSGLETSKNMSE